MSEEKLMRSADVMAERLKDPTKVDEVRGDPQVLDALAKDAKAATEATFQITRRANAIEADRMIYRMTTWFLGSAILVVAIGIIAIRIIPMFVLTPEQLASVTNVPFAIPDSLVAIASAAVGALAGLLSPLGNRAG